MFVHVLKTLKVLLLAGLVTVFAGCAAGPQIHSAYEPSVNFNQYKTFSFLDSLEPQGEKDYRSLSDKYLMDAIRNELSSRGLQEDEKGELLVGFELTSKEKVRSVTTPSLQTGLFTVRSRFGFSYGFGYGHETHVSQYTEGTLTIDVVDAKEKQVIWQGISIGKLKHSEDNDLEQRTRAVVRSIFEEYPVATSRVTVGQ